MASSNRRWWRDVFIAVLLMFVLLPVRAQDTNGLPLFTRQPNCESTGATNLLRLRAEVSGAESLQWMSNNVPVPGGTNLTIEFAPNLTNVTAYVLIASNSVGVVPSDLVWGHACEGYTLEGAVQLNSTEQLVLDGNGVPIADGWVRLHVARIPEELGSGNFRIPIPPLQVKDGRIANDPRMVLYPPGTRVYSRFIQLGDPNELEGHGFSKIFEATVGTISEPGSLDPVEPWRFRSIFCYGLIWKYPRIFTMQVGRPAQVMTDYNRIACGAQQDLFYDDNWQATWRKNGVPIDATHPINDKTRSVTFADAGVYELHQRYDQAVRLYNFVVSLREPAEFSVAQVENGSVRLSIRSGSTGSYRLEQSNDLVQWTLVQVGNYTNSASVVEVQVTANDGKKFYRLK